MKHIEIEMLKILVQIQVELDEQSIYEPLLEEGYTNIQIDGLIKACED